MKLYERLEYLKVDPKKLAVNFAEYMRWDEEADRSEIGKELFAILERLAQLTADLERIEEEKDTKRSAWDDFADIPGLPQPPPGAELASIEARKDARAEAENTRVNVEAIISSLDCLFCEICRALTFEGLSITSGEIAALKRYGMPQHLASALEGIKKKHISTIPEAERLSIDVATTLHKYLMFQGFISGSLEAFIFHFGQHSNKRIKSPNTAISWLGTDAQFAFFVLRLSQYMQRDERGCLVRQKAICEAFRMEKKKQINTIRPYISKFRKGQRCRGYEQIKLIFDNLPI